MRVLILLLFFTQILIHLLQIISLHFKHPQVWIPYIAPTVQNQTSVSDSVKKITNNQRKVNSTSRSESSVEILEAMRKEQLSQLNMAENLNPVQLNQEALGMSKVNHSYIKPVMPPNLEAFFNNLKNYFLFQDPKLVLVWFNSEIKPPSIFRWLWLGISSLGFLALLSLTPFLFGGKRGPYDEFLKWVKGSNLKKALSLWQDENIRSRFQEEPHKLQVKWFKILVKGKKLESARDWGTVVFQNKPKDKNHAMNLCQVILATSNQGIDLKFSSLLNWYLSEKQDAKAAQIIWEKGIRDYEHSMLAPEVHELCMTLQKILNHPELACFINDHPVYSN